MRVRPGGRGRVRRLLAAAAFLCMGGAALAQREAATPPQGQEPTAHAPTVPAPTVSAAEIRVFSPEEDLALLLDACAALSGTPIEFDRSEVSGSIGLRLPAPITEESLFELASRALVARGLTTVQMPGSPSLTVVKLADAPGLARLEDRSLHGSRAGFVKVLVELVHDRTETVAEGVKLVLSEHGTLASFKPARSFLVADLRPNVSQALRVAARLDGEFAEMEVFEFPLERTDPVALVALLERITATKKAVFGEKPAGTVLAHPEARSVLVVAPAIEMDVWRELVRRFDRVEPTRTQNYFPRRFGVRETASLIEQVVPVGSDKRGWRVVADELTGALVVTATPAQHQAIVVGGLEVATKSFASTRVPLLGAIPLLGALFSDQSKTESKARFFVFIRASVMRSQNFADLRFASGADLALAGVDDGWPELSPRLIR